MTHLTTKKTGHTTSDRSMSFNFRNCFEFFQMKKIDYIFILLFSFLFVSCNNEADYITNDTNNEIYGFSHKVGGANLSSYWSAGDAIGITVYVSGCEDLYLNNLNKQYKATSNATFAPASEDDAIHQPLVYDVVDFIAYYPYKTTVSTVYDIFLSEQSNQKQIDLLYSNNAKGETKSSKNIELVFNHVLSKIVINAMPANGLVAEDLIGLSITIDSVFSEGSFNLVSGELVSSGQKSSIKMKTETNGSSSEAIILPELTSGAGFTIKLASGHIYGADFPQEQQFISGHNYIYNITITKTGIILSPIEIEDWIVDDEIPQEEVADEVVYKIGDFYPNPNNPKTAIGIVYWLKPGTGGKEGKMVSYDSAMRNWGNSNNENLRTSISTGIINWEIVTNWDFSLENFPAFKWCKDKGDGWYLPSRYELHILNELWTANQEYMNGNIEQINGEPFTLNDVYLASSESRSWPYDNAETYSFSNKGWGPILKSVAGRIRALKEF